MGAPGEIRWCGSFELGLRRRDGPAGSWVDTLSVVNRCRTLCSTTSPVRPSPTAPLERTGPFPAGTYAYIRETLDSAAPVNSGCLSDRFLTFGSPMYHTALTPLTTTSTRRHPLRRVPTDHGHHGLFHNIAFAIKRCVHNPFLLGEADCTIALRFKANRSDCPR